MRRLEARYSGKCVVCGGRFPEGTEIFWEPGRAKHAEPLACAAEFKAKEATKAAEKAAAWAAELAAMSPSERECHEREKWNTGHGLCPEGCCGHVTECAEPGCRCHVKPTALKPHGGTTAEAARGVGWMEALK